jgi:hypothetical protein
VGRYDDGLAVKLGRVGAQATAMPNTLPQQNAAAISVLAQKTAASSSALRSVGLGMVAGVLTNILWNRLAR